MTIREARYLQSAVEHCGNGEAVGIVKHYIQKWFAAVEMIRLATDQDWLQATKKMAKFRESKHARCHDLTA